MSILLPFLILLAATAFAAYHRLRLAVWAAATATLLVACWLLGADKTATSVAAVLVALVALPLLLPFLRMPLITRPLLGFYTKILPPLTAPLKLVIVTSCRQWAHQTLACRRAGEQANSQVR